MDVQGCQGVKNFRQDARRCMDACWWGIRGFTQTFPALGPVHSRSTRVLNDSHTQKFIPLLRSNFCERPLKLNKSKSRRTWNSTHFASEGRNQFRTQHASPTTPTNSTCHWDNKCFTGDIITLVKKLYILLPTLKYEKQVNILPYQIILHEEGLCKAT